MATEWEGKSRGTLLGYKIYIFFLCNFGIGSAYFILHLVIFYYVLFSPRSNKDTYNYFRKRHKYSIGKSLASIYKSYYTFGKTLTDKVAISTGLRHKFTYTHDGIEHIDNLLKKNQGGILISGHVGNFEISHYFLEDRYSISKISMVTTMAEHENIQEYMEQISVKSHLKFIVVKDDMSHIFEIHKAIDEGGLVVFTGDRYMPGGKVLNESFLGKEASFPMGPYLLASRLNMPVLFVYFMKGEKRHYDLYARTAEFKARDAQGLLKEYTQSMEWILKKYPLQWFNYYDFWKDRKNS
ncbi:lipid A biosynthesis acyltransferase [Maribacter algarum]|uniref:Lipid A biosynthesis acyltransferase n=1 Tax=Maribacter algarum (ex Zhang et al. 2020) TaxID=2578118 RepID=A0A5S3PU68_9FLAO|nr:lipid A biosynthesis acyltransferase [Maribacter algarum]TMM58513.1 lipid A biosynthesis acyltransferase [Maribacter algarum]